MAAQLERQFAELASNMPGSQEEIPERFRRLGDLLWSAASAFEMIKIFAEADAPPTVLRQQLRRAGEDIESASTEGRRIGCPIGSLP